MVSTLGARESNAGDEFHNLWAARRAVRLLEPKSGLCRVVMEGVSPVDADSLEDIEDLLLGVDSDVYRGFVLKNPREEVIKKLCIRLDSRMLMTSRSHRRVTVQPPSGIVEFELKGFDREASTAHLQQVFPKADAESGALFHANTNGNPRVQYYLLDTHRIA